MIFNELIMQHKEAEEPIVLTTTGTWTCKKEGVYYIEIHGGGGAGLGKRNNASGAAGGGSGECYAKRLYVNDTIKVTAIGSGGKTSSISTLNIATSITSPLDGNTTTVVFTIQDTSTTVSLAGGKGGTASDNVRADCSGSLAEKGAAGTSSNLYNKTIPGGGSGGSLVGNYGDGGNGGAVTTGNDSKGRDGKDGAVIILFIHEINHSGGYI